MTDQWPAPVRLWRVRKRRDHIDAVLTRGGTAWDLRLLLNGRRLLFDARCTSARQARETASARLRELQRAGWAVHW